MVKCSKAEVRRLKTALRWKIPAAQRERIQMVLLRESGMNGGRKHENMTLAEEKALLAHFAKTAGAGEMLNIHDLKAAYEGDRARNQQQHGL